MTKSQQVLLADIGEGLTEAQVRDLLVEVGQSVTRLDPVVEVETSKATVEITTPYSGVVSKILVQSDQWINVGDPICEIDATDG